MDLAALLSSFHLFVVLHRFLDLLLLIFFGLLLSVLILLAKHLNIVNLVHLLLLVLSIFLGVLDLSFFLLLLVGHLVVVVLCLLLILRSFAEHLFDFQGCLLLLLFDGLFVVLSIDFFVGLLDLFYRLLLQLSWSHSDLTIVFIVLHVVMRCIAVRIGVLQRLLALLQLLLFLLLFGFFHQLQLG